MTVKTRGYLLVAIQFALLAGIFAWRHPFDWPSSQTLQGIALLLQLMGFAVLGLGLVTLGRSLTAHPEPLARATLKTNGIYSIVRHPIYTGILAASIGQALLARSWVTTVFVVALLALFMVKSRFEEQLLMQKFSDYRDYASRVGRLIPLIGRIR